MIQNPHFHSVFPYPLRLVTDSSSQRGLPQCLPERGHGACGEVLPLDEHMLCPRDQDLIPVILGVPASALHCSPGSSPIRLPAPCGCSSRCLPTVRDPGNSWHAAAAGSALPHPGL